MRWTQRSRTDVRAVIDKFDIYGKVLAESRQKLRGAGAPCTYYQNTSLTYYGTAPTDATKCYCWGQQQTAPDRSHFLCLGTGYLEGYQKYGYKEHVLSTPSTFTSKDTGIVVSGERGGEYILSSNTATQADLIFDRIPLTNFYEVDRVFIKQKVDLTVNEIQYFFTIDDINWIRIPLNAIADNPLCDFSGILNVFSIIQPTTTFIRFRIRFRKRTVTSPSGQFNSIRFRYRNQLLLSETDQRFSHISRPAFLAAREQQTIEITQGEFGWTTKRPLRWWVLPEVNIKNDDLIQFLEGSLANEFYLVSSLIPSVHGPSLQVLHRDFESSFIRDNNDLIKVLHLLS